MGPCILAGSRQHVSEDIWAEVEQLAAKQIRDIYNCYIAVIYFFEPKAAEEVTALEPWYQTRNNACLHCPDSNE